MINAYLFDIGNVLVRFDHKRSLEKIVKQSSSMPEVIWKALEPLIGPLESGQLSAAEFLKQAVTASSFTGGVDAFASHYCDIFSSNDPMWELVAELKQQHPLYLFSNTSELHLAHLETEFPGFAAFSGGIYSMNVGAMKPKPQMYEAAIELMNMPPEEVFYIDDLPANIEQGKAFGFQTHTYDWRNHAALLEAIKAAS